MPNPEVTGPAALHSREIKKIASQIATIYYNDDEIYDCHLWHKEEPIKRKAEEIEDIINSILHDYCIVPKSKVTEKVKNTKWMKAHGRTFEAEVREELLTDLFGKSLFDEEKP